MSSKRENMQFLPVSLNITNKKILVIGGGKVALHKISTLLKFTGNITILAPVIDEELIRNESLKLLIKSYEKKDLRKFHLVYACTNNRTLNAEIRKDAASIGLLVNVADDPLLCDFVSPAIARNGYITIAVGSNARNVKEAIEIRDQIKKILHYD